MLIANYVPMYIESVPNQSSPPAILLRKSCSENGKGKKSTILNLTKRDPKIVDVLRQVLKGGSVALKTVDSMVRPMFHRTETWVRSHVLICMFDYYVGWHIRQKLKPMLFDEEHLEITQDECQSIVQPAKVSARTQLKAQTKRTHDGDLVYSLNTLLNDLATLSQSTVSRMCWARRTKNFSLSQLQSKNRRSNGWEIA